MQQEKRFEIVGKEKTFQKKFFKQSLDI